MVEVYAGLHRSDQLMAKVDGTILEYIRLLIMAGEFAKAAARAALVREVSAEFEISWVVLMQVIRLAMSCGAPIDAARTDAEKLYSSIHVWGKTHVSLWKSGGLGNLAHSDSAKLVEGRSVSLRCPHEASKIRRVRFASYGDPGGPNIKLRHLFRTFLVRNYHLPRQARDKRKETLRKRRRFRRGVLCRRLRRTGGLRAWQLPCGVIDAGGRSAVRW